MKKIVPILVGFIIGAIFMYAVLWFQVYQKWNKMWCQIYTGHFSVEQSQKCKDL